MTTNAMFIRAGRRIVSLSNNNNCKLILKTTKIQRVTTLVQQVSNSSRSRSRSLNYAAIANNNNDAKYQYFETFHRRPLSNKASSEASEASEEESKAGEEVSAAPPPPPQTDEDNNSEGARAADAAGEGEKEEGKKVEPEESREEKLVIEIQDLKNNLLRSLAEQENTRMIAKKDVESARNFAIKSFAKGLLDVSDNLSRAMDAVPEEFRNNDNNNEGEVNHVLATLYEGIHMTEAGLTKAFQSNGLFKFGKDGDVFDPNVHNALFEFPDEKKSPGTVGQVIKNGFLLNKRVLRPAEVGVVKKP